MDKFLDIDFSGLKITKTTKPKTGCWILDYQPSLSNLIFPKNFKEYIISILGYDKSISYHTTTGLILPYHLIISSPSGYGKWTIVKAIMMSYYNIDLDDIRKIKNEIEYTSSGVPTKENSLEFIKYIDSPLCLIYFINVINLKNKNKRLYIEFLIDSLSIRTTKKIFIIRNIEHFERNHQDIIANLMEKYYLYP